MERFSKIDFIKIAAASAVWPTHNKHSVCICLDFWKIKFSKHMQRSFLALEMRGEVCSGVQMKRSIECTE